MTKKKTGRVRRMAELLETAKGLRRSGLMTRADYDKITAPASIRASSRDRVRHGVRRG